jgi:hypothetical protein
MTETSASGQKQTSRDRHQFVRLVPEADITGVPCRLYTRLTANRSL